MRFGRGFFGQSEESESEDITPGTVFCKDATKGDLMEVAKVLSVCRKRGVPHVRFEVGYKHPSFRSFRDFRVLALSSFSRQYPDRL